METAPVAVAEVRGTAIWIGEVDWRESRTGADVGRVHAGQFKIANLLRLKHLAL